MLLSVRDLTINYKGVKGSPAVDSISFDIAESEITGLCGQSGSGKSSIAMAITGLLKKETVSGKVLFTGEKSLNIPESSIQELNQIRGKEISIIFQEPALSFSPVYTCGRQMSDALRIHQKLRPEEMKAVCLDILKKCGIDNAEKIFDSYPHEISGGQLQRVAIATAIVNQPKLLIADEITSNLDAGNEEKIIELLRDLNKSMGLAILFISHNLELLRHFTEKLIIINEGQLIESDKTEDIFSKPENEYTRKLIENSRLKVNERISDPKNPPILEVQNLSIEYRKNKSFFLAGKNTFRAVKNANFQLRRSEILGLAGKSGSGKTSIGKSVVRLIDMASGDIRFKGKSIPGLSSSELRAFRRKVQFIFQDPESSLDPRLSITYSLKEALLAGPESPDSIVINERISEITGLTGLRKDLLDRLPSELSGGEKQRVCIARALLAEPEILICDEAVSALDAGTKKDILNLLSELRNQLDISIIFISHDRSVLYHLCDRIIELENGEIVDEKIPASHNVI